MGIEYLFMAILGGSGHILGAMVGAALITLLQNALQDALPHFSRNGEQLEVDRVRDHLRAGAAIRPPRRDAVRAAPYLPQRATAADRLRRAAAAPLNAADRHAAARRRASA